MNGFACPADRNLDSGQEIQSQPGGLLGCFGQAADLVVIRQRQQLHAIAMSTPDHLTRGQRAVRDGRMAMQVDIQSPGIAGARPGLRLAGSRRRIVGGAD